MDAPPALRFYFSRLTLMLFDHFACPKLGKSTAEDVNALFEGTCGWLLRDGWPVRVEGTIQSSKPTDTV